jgi:hypothetical protein
VLGLDCPVSAGGVIDGKVRLIVVPSMYVTEAYVVSIEPYVAVVVVKPDPAMLYAMMPVCTLLLKVNIPAVMFEIAVGSV